MVHVDMVIGVVTCAGKLSTVVEHAEETIHTKTVQAIKDNAMALLMDRDILKSQVST